MSFKDLLLHLPAADLRGRHAGDDYAIDFAAAFGAHLTALAVGRAVPAPVTLYDGATMPDLDAARRSQDTALKVAADEFSTKAAAAGIAADVVTVQADAAAFDAVVADHARVKDLAILPMPDGAESQPIVQNVLFESGRPVLLVPAAARAFTCEHVIVAWDGTGPAVRALHEALPILAKAGRTTIVSISDDKPARLNEVGRELERHLGRHGVTAAFRHLDSGGRAIADALTHHASTLGGDMLVMGAFAHSRLRDFVLGGATRGILERLPMPALLSR